MRNYGKLFWATAGAVVFFLQAAVTDGLTAEEWIGTAIAAVGAAVVWMAPDTTLSPWVKSAAGGLLAALTAAQVVINGGIDGQEWIGIVVALLSGAGVVLDPRRPVRVVSLHPGADRAVAA